MNRGYVLIEVLLGGIILALCIGVAMYLFNLGYSLLIKSKNNQIICSKIPIALNIIKSLPEKEGVLHLGDDVLLKWKAEEISKTEVLGEDIKLKKVQFKIFLYKVHFTLERDKIKRIYETFIIKNEKI